MVNKFRDYRILKVFLNFCVKIFVKVNGLGKSRLLMHAPCAITLCGNTSCREISANKIFMINDCSRKSQFITLENFQLYSIVLVNWWFVVLPLV